MAKPLIPAGDILDHALRLLDAEGVEALNVRRLSADLKISPRTLYQQVGNQEAMIRALVARHFAQLKLEFEDYGAWELTAQHWCIALNDTLCAHPYITELMTIDDRAAVTDYVQSLLESTLQAGIPRGLAVECCRGLTNLTIHHSIAEVRARREAERSPETLPEIAKINRNFGRLVQWVIAGVRAEAESTPKRSALRRRSAAANAGRRLAKTANPRGTSS
jgi:AcrR family transcriptional regulator